MKKYIPLAIIALAFTLLIPASSAYAQQKAQTPNPANTGQALEIGPPVVNLTGDPGQTITTNLSLRDVSASKLVVSNEINDFVADDSEDGTPKILLKSGETSPYSIKSWISPLPKITLVPKQIQTIKLTIKIPNNAAPGGYYGVVRFTGAPPDVEGNGVALSASLGVLVLLKVNGEVKEEMKTEEFYLTDRSNKRNWLFESGPLKVIERVRNNGNIHEQPVGQVKITDMFGQPVATLNVNLPPRNVLPGSVRKFEQALDDTVIGNRMLFGKYTAKMELTYGGSVEKLSASTEFWVIPYRLILLAIAGLVVLFFVLRFTLKRYRERILSQASRRRR